MRTRREQVDFDNRLAGRRIPTRDELVAGYETQRMTGVYGVTSRVRLLLIGYAIPARATGKRVELIAAQRERLRNQRPIGMFVELYRAGRSATAIARQTGWDRKTVAADLHDAGIRFGALPPIGEWVDRYVTGGETGAEIAASYGVTAAAIYRAMKVAGVARRRAVVRPAATAFSKPTTSRPPAHSPPASRQPASAAGSRSVPSLPTGGPRLPRARTRAGRGLALGSVARGRLWPNARHVNPRMDGQRPEPSSARVVAQPAP